MPATADFFVPDLCNVPALSLLILFGEPIVTVLTLASERPDWGRFGWMSLFVQWIVLASAGGLCVTRSAMARWPMHVGATSAWLLIVVITLLLTAIGEQVVFGELRAFDLARNSLLAAVIGGMALRFKHGAHRTQRARLAGARPAEYADQPIRRRGDHQHCGSLHWIQRIAFRATQNIRRRSNSRHRAAPGIQRRQHTLLA